MQNLASPAIASFGTKIGPHALSYNSSMGHSGSAHRRLGPELAHHEVGRDRLSTSDLSTDVPALWYASFGPGLAGHESTLSHSSAVLARVVGLGHLQYVHLACPDPVSYTHLTLPTIYSV